MNNSAGVSRNAETAYPTGVWSMLPVFSRVRVAHVLLLLCMYDFSYFMFIVVYVCFPCLVFVPGLHSGTSVFARKGDGSVQYCRDYRDFNKKDLPNVSHYLSTLSGLWYFSTFGLNSGFYIVSCRLSEEIFFEHLRLPMGLPSGIPND